MKERPILFSSTMVRAILDGRKTQTRRTIKRQPPDQHYLCRKLLKTSGDQRRVGKYFYLDTHNRRADDVYFNCPYGKTGDRLWVRETFQIFENAIAYVASPDTYAPYRSDDIRWKPSIFMPRELSRITLEIINIRVERLQDISEEDAIAEGAEPSGVGSSLEHLAYRAGYQYLWEQINGKGSWDINPFVWVIQFRMCRDAFDLR